MSTEQSVVWILGAGFSRALGAPLLSQMLSPEALKRVRATYPNLDPGSVVAFEDVVRNYQHGAYGAAHFPQKERLWEHAEEFLERLDIALRDDVAAKVLQTSWIGPPEQDAFTHGWAAQIVVPALKLMAAEICAFLDRADLRTERWQPYLRWANMLQPQDTVLTFNYDRVPDLLEDKYGSKLHVYTPAELEASEPFQVAQILKLHGSVDWLRADGKFDRVAPSHRLYEHRNQIALFVDHPTEGGIATPGPSKVALVENKHGLQPLWKRAAAALETAGAVVVIGYSLPPTDAYTRRWLLDRLRRNLHERGAKSLRLPINTVMGADVGHRDSVRLKGLFESLGGVCVLQRPMFGEDFMDAFDRDLLFVSQPQ